MENLEVNGVLTLRGFGTDKHGNPTAIFKGDTGYTQANPVVGDRWREMNIGAQYVIESSIYPVQTSMDDDPAQTTIEYEDDLDDSNLLLPQGVEPSDG